MEKHGRITFRKLEDNDHARLQEFCSKCRDLGYKNNSTFKDIKLDQMKMPYGQFFIGEIDGYIFNLAGVHHMPELNKNAYRCLFRGAVLPKHVTSRGGLKNSWQFTVTLNQQIDFILSLNPNAEFYLTSNKEQINGKSSVIDKVFNPKAEQLGIMKLVDGNFYYMYTEQRLWKINVNAYKQWRLV
jgi:hypothetical protein